MFVENRECKYTEKILSSGPTKHFRQKYPRRSLLTDYSVLSAVKHESIGRSIGRRSLDTSWSKIDVSNPCPRNFEIFDPRRTPRESTLDMLEWVIRGSAEFDSSLKSSLRSQEARSELTVRRMRIRAHSAPLV